MKTEQVTITVLPDNGGGATIDPYKVTPAEAELRAMKARWFAEHKITLRNTDLSRIVDGR